MSKSLFNISDEYIRLMNQIEENEGVLDEQLEKELEINQQQLEEKIKSYHHIIKEKEAEQQLIEDEKKRLSNLSKTKDNLIEHLKSKVLDAVNLFGYDGKSGNKKLDFDTLKVWTGARESVTIHDDFEFLLNANIALDKNKLSTIYRYKVNIELNNIQFDKLLKLCNSEEFNSISTDKVNIHIEPKMDKTFLKSILDKGEKIPGCQIVKNQYVTFK
jgi:hypothetical protein